MVWGMFGAVHIISLIIAAAIIVGVYYLLKAMPEKARYISMIILSLSGVAAIIFNLVSWGTPLEYLPLHMCSITAIILPITVITKSKVLGNLLMVWSVGSIFAVIFHNGPDFKIPSAVFFFYFIPHIFEFAVTVYMFKFRYVKAEAKYIPSTIGITFGIYTVVHIINLAINRYFAINNITDPSGAIKHVNYMFSVAPPHGNPLLEMFFKVIPHPYWYMYMSLIILAVYLSAVFLCKALISSAKAKNKRA